MMLGIRIKEIREEKGFTQKAFGRNLGLKPLQIVRYEKGEQTPSARILEKISLIYSVSIDWLITGEGDKYRDPGGVMGLDKAKAFFIRYPKLEKERPGLYRFLSEDDWREKYRVSEREAEYLANIELRAEQGRAKAEDYAQELTRYREMPKWTMAELSPEEKRILQGYRRLPDDAQQLINDFVELLISRRKQK